MYGTSIKPLAIDMDATVSVAFTVSTTYVVTDMTVRSIVDLLESTAKDQGVTVKRPNPNDIDDPTDVTEHVFFLLDDHPALREIVFAEWIHEGADIEDTESTVEEVV